MNQPEFDRKFRDRVTGFEGVCTGIAHYMDGTTQALLAPKVDDTGLLRDSKWFDAGRLEDADASSKGPVGFGGK